MSGARKRPRFVSLVVGDTPPLCQLLSAWLWSSPTIRQLARRSGTSTARVDSSDSAVRCALAEVLTPPETLEQLGVWVRACDTLSLRPLSTFLDPLLYEAIDPDVNLREQVLAPSLPPSGDSDLCFSVLAKYGIVSDNPSPDRHTLLLLYRVAMQRPDGYTLLRNAESLLFALGAPFARLAVGVALKRLVADQWLLRDDEVFELVGTLRSLRPVDLLPMTRPVCRHRLPLPVGAATRTCVARSIEDLRETILRSMPWMSDSWSKESPRRVWLSGSTLLQCATGVWDSESPSEILLSDMGAPVDENFVVLGHLEDLTVLSLPMHRAAFDGETLLMCPSALSAWTAGISWIPTETDLDLHRCFAEWRVGFDLVCDHRTRVDILHYCRCVDPDWSALVEEPSARWLLDAPTEVETALACLEAVVA